MGGWAGRAAAGGAAAGDAAQFSNGERNNRVKGDGESGGASQESGSPSLSLP